MNRTLIIPQRRMRELPHSPARIRSAMQKTRRRARPRAALVAGILSCMLLASPVLRVYADESALAPVEAEVLIAEELSPMSASEEIIEDAEAPPSDAIVDSFFETPEAVEEAAASSTESSATVATASSTQEILPQEPAVATSSTPIVTSALPEVDATTTATTTSHASTTPESVPVESPQEHAVPDIPQHDTSAPETEEEVASSTPAPDGEVINFVTNDENRFSFGQNECVAVGDGSFYCTTAAAAPRPGDDGVVAQMDAEGDMEIYFIKKGAQIQVTHNAVDDTSPFYDSVSQRIVWHSHIDDRYQIMSYDTRRGETTQLTETTYNNMEPSAYGDVTLWQAWIDGNWDIVMYEHGEVKRLTENIGHDIAPHIRGDYILWQTHEGDAWHVKVFDQKTGLIDTIDGGAGVSVENPRFVLVYDSKKENGDIETLGYDFDSKNVIPLATTPAPLPERLPEPEEDGEERALPQQQTQTRTETRSEEGDGGDGTGNGNDDVASSTSSGGEADETTASSTDMLSDFDLVITPHTQDSVASSSIVSDNDEQ